MPTGAAATSLCGGAPALRVVMISLHTSPLSQAGSGDAGGMNVYVDALSRSLRAAGVGIDIITTDADAGAPSRGRDSTTVLEDGRRVHSLHLPVEASGDKNRLAPHAERIAARGLAALRAADATPVTTVHSHYWISGVAGLRMAEELGAVQGATVPLVHTMHTIGAVKSERDPRTSEDPRRDAAEAAVAARADALTANTGREIADLRRLFDVPEERIALVEPGVDLGVFHPPAEPDPRAELSGRPLRLTFAGRLQTHKGPQVAVAAAAALRRRFPEQSLELVVAGRQSGSDTLDVEALAWRHGVEDVLQTLEPLPHPELAELFRRSDAVLMPSCSESFGLVALEAMACGTPVLAHEVGGLSALVNHRRTGRLIESLDPEAWAQQMRWLVLHRRAWERYSAAAAAAAQSYSWAATANSSLKLYRALAPAYAG